MFNKTPPFGRNEPAARRDPTPVLAAGTRTPIAERSAPQANPADTPAPSAPAAPTTTTTDASGAEKANEGFGAARLIVGREVKLKGAEILDCDTLVVEGRVEATMDSRLIRIAENGSFAGNVSIDVAEIHGRFEGELTARSQLIIHATGRVSGTIRFGKLVVAEGGELNGEISVIAAPTALPAQASGESLRALGTSAA